MIQKIKYCLLFLLFATQIGLAGDDFISLMPRYAADTVHHRNKLDQNGQKWGKWQYYSRDGILLLEIEYKANVRDGVYVRYNPVSGKMIEKGNYKNGLKHGSFTKWFSSGEKRVEGQYQNSLKSGHWAYFHKGSDATMRMSGKFVQGKKTGSWIFYDRSGTIKRIIKYENGEIISDNPDSLKAK